VTPEEVEEVFNQYQYDWTNWPGEDGAPYEDVDGDGDYTPAVWQDGAWVGDIPGWPGASQTLWTAANDFPFADGGEIAPNIYGSIGIGFEEQLSVWGYAFPASNPLGNIQFKRARMIFYGRSADAYIDTAYFTQWSDPDLGTYTDDYVGFDTVLSLGYVYNGNTLDATYNGSFGLPVPAGGYDFLQGPKVDGIPLGMTSSGYFGAGSSISDPDQEEYSGTLQWFNLMEGFLPRPEYPTQTPWVDNAGNETIFPLAGDPVAGTGDIDGRVLPPGDRRLLMSSGPFTMAVGDTQDVVLALIGAMGTNNLSSVAVLKYFDIFAQFAYDNDFVLPNPPAAPAVEVLPADGAITLYWGKDPDAVAATEIPVKSGFAFEGYKVYQLPNADATASEGVVVAIFDMQNNGVTTITEKTIDAASGLVLDLPAHIGNDLGVQRYVRLDRDMIRNRPMTNDRPYYYGVSSYSYLPDNATSPFKSLESTMARVTVYPQLLQYDVYNAEFLDELEITHTTGLAGGVVTGSVIDPSVLTGHDYAVWFDQQHYFLDADGVWNKTDAPAAGKLFDVSPSTVTGVASTAPGGAMDLTFVATIESPEYNYVSGVLITLPPEIVINSASSADGFAAPTDFSTYTHIRPDGSTDVFDGARATAWLNYDQAGKPYIVTTYGIQGWAASSRAIDTQGFGTTAISDLQRDYELRWNAEWDAGTASGGVNYIQPTGGGSQAVIWGVRNYGGGLALESHPDPDNPGTGDPFFIDIPFEVWDMEAEGGPAQVGFVIYDRMQDVTAGGDYYTFNNHNRMYCEFILVPYDEFIAMDPAAVIESDRMTWNTVWWNADHTVGDVVLFAYANPILHGIDEWAFSTSAPTTRTLTDDDIDMINIFPNPYYGFQELEIARAVKFATINHLPQRATIRIFNLGGNLVRTIEKDDATQYAEWDLENQYGFPVASGVYVIHIDLPDLGKETVLKFAMVQEEQILLSY
jgi:hypothetical protein